MHWRILVLVVGALAGTRAQLGDASNATQDDDLCPADQVYDPCIMRPCPPRQGCIQVCSPGCRCKNGLVKDEDGKCVISSTNLAVLQSPRPVCPKNEHFEINSNRCQITCDNMQYEDVMGACAPNNACYCNSDDVRDKNGNCIKRENCPPPKCSKGEVWSDCGTCPTTCENRGNTCLACIAACIPGCYCAGTTIRAPNGTCVEPKNCPKRTCKGVNEIFYKCPSTCPRDDKCENLWSKKPCTPVDCCEPKCRCKPGYFRTNQNKCVSEKECRKPTQCGHNEIFTDCLNDCETTCKNRFKSDRKPCARVCRGSGCICKPNYMRHDNGTCVQEYECSPAECDKGKVYNACGSSCPPSCENKGNTCLVCTAQCVPGCFCAKGTFSGPNNTCVKPENCPRPNCGPNAHFVKCPPTCPKTDSCKNLFSKEPCTPIDCCHPQCRCKSGFYRKNDICVTAQECRKPTQCGHNEVFTDCLNDCETTCKNRFKSDRKPCARVCRGSGCICKPNYMRHDNGTCVQEYECSPAECDKGKVYNACGSSCPPSCENKGNTCLVCTAQCVPGCFCAKGTFSGPNNTCVKPENCPRPNCGPNAQFVKCPPTCPRTDSCKNLFSKEPCTPTDCCHPQCRCKSGFYRKNDICVTAQECRKPTQCGINEVFTDCLNDCETTCKNRFKSDRKPCARVCRGSGCICKPNYMRHDNGTCVQEYECSPAECDKGKVYNACGSSCPPSCENKGNTCLVCTAQCVPGCFCEKGTFSGSNNTCVKPENCPQPNCGPNAHFVKCPPTCPKTDSCKNLFSKEPCTPIDCCHPQCRCKSGFYRKNDICVTAQECRKPTQCGHNEVFTDCLNDCETTCKNRFKSDRKPCARVCRGSGCICKPNYMRHDNGTCVQEYECSPAECDKGKVYNACGSSCPPSCENKGNTCLVCTAQCVPGCFCAKRTVSGPNNTCVKPENCPRPNCGPNAHFVKCPPTCPRTDSCKNLFSKEPCTPTDCCHPQCRCKSGFYRKNDICVTAQECRSD